MSDDLKDIDFTQTKPIENNNNNNSDSLQNININLDSKDNIIENIKTDLIKENSQTMATNLVENAQSKLEKTTIEKLLCFLNYFRDYFKITTNDIKKRLILSFNPLKMNFIKKQ